MMAAEITRASVGLRSERGPILLSLMLSTSLVALDSTIIATAIPSVVDDLGGFGQFPWLFSVYLLAQAASTPIYGRLADIFGRKPLMFLGIGLFLLGSILCGLAWSMPALIVFRAVQGLGAGAIQPVSITIAGDIYSLRERAKVQGYLASVWGISSVVGPALGGIFSDLVSWRWIFFVNIPLCLIAGFLLWRNFSEKAVRSDQKIDFLGAGLLASSTALLILGLLEGGQAWPWLSLPSAAVFAAAALLLVVFVVVERRVASPILPLWVLRRRVLLASSVASLLVGAIVLGLSSYIPTYGQIVLGTTALVAGFALAALTIGWPIAASFAGAIYLRYGFRATAVLGSALALVGTALTLTLDASSQIWEVAVYCVIVGLGMGWVAAPTLIAAQSSVEWNERGVVTSTNLFARSIGSAVGVAVFGAIVNGVAGPSEGGTPSAERLVPALHLVFLGMTGIALALVVAAAFMPAHRRDGQVVAPGAAAPDPA
ncbi:MAG: putative MFS-type transporter yusP [Naasia sp.]|jgi:EmrB/QacA subfamily drug resistance transporter|uniref:MDR family MFS transporter n=1 Tax=Naasia sp. TaxID=2546198 RepID=UPI002630B525|nr:MDR family MFS transporter [Naasia sp.]MCU1570623.1 putative MFS-type transporter yusP [Naasia sp.]